MLLGARTLLGAPGLTTRRKKLLGAKGIATRSKDAMRLEAIAMVPFSLSSLGPVPFFASGWATLRFASDVANVVRTCTFARPL